MGARLQSLERQRSDMERARDELKVRWGQRKGMQCRLLCESVLGAAS